jgi:hypothetical protein
MRIQLALILLTVTFTAYGQFEDTKYVVGGAVDYDTNAFTNNASLGIAPSFARTLNANSLIGLSGKYQNSDSKVDATTAKLNIHIVDVDIFYQHFYPIGEHIFFNWRVVAGLGFNHYKPVTNRDNTQEYHMRIVPGFGWKIMDKLMLCASLGGVGYSWTKDSFTNRNNPIHIENSLLEIYFNRPQFAFIFLIKK